MKKLLYIIISLDLFIAAQVVFSQQKSFPATYQAPVFKDSGRLKKMEAAFPVIEKLFREHAEKNHFPGMAFGVVADGKLIYSGAVGYTEERKKIAATTKSVFRIASMSKSFTGLAILQLRDAGKLQLDDPVSKYIPQMKQVKYLTSDAPAITIRNLITHSAGFPEDNPWGDRQLADSDAELLAIIKGGVNFSTVPSTSFEYSNLGFALAGHVITRVSGMPYQKYIDENILKPLGMKNTYWEFSKVPEVQLAHGYRWINNNWEEETLLHDGSYGAMGGLMTSIEDFYKYMLIHMAAWPPSSKNEHKILKRSSVREMHHPGSVAGAFVQARSNGRTCAVVSGYGYGLGWTRDCDGKTVVGHSGGLPGFGSQWVILPEYGIGVVSFANRTYAGTGSVNGRVIDTLIAIAGLSPSQLPASPILKQRKEELMKLLPHWNQTEQQSEIFAENFFPDYPIDSLKNQAAIVFANAGKILRVREIVPENQLRGRFILEGEKKNIEVFFTLTPENPPLIQEYRIRELEKGQ